MIIDAHAHIFPEKIAERAVAGIGSFYDLNMTFDGKVSTLINVGDKAGIDKFVVHSVATNEAQVESINNFIADSVKAYPDRLIGFATIHPSFADIPAEIERAVSLGLKGVKIHPDFQQFEIDCREAYKIYECIEGRLPLLVHTGDYRYEWSKPERMAKVLDDFPKLDVIGAHFGGWSVWEHAADILSKKRIWVDTSSSLYALPPEKAAELIRKYGADRVLFGTDYPMWDASSELKLFSKIPLNDDERELILYKNVLDLLKLN